MKACTFFGHRDCPESVEAALLEKLENLIKERGVRQFYIGRQGRFDMYACNAVRRLQSRYPDIGYTVVLAYHPGKKRDDEEDDTIYPAGLEKAPFRYAIDRRNLWMLAHAEIVVCYIQHSWGGAARFVRQARRQGREVINLYHASDKNGDNSAQGHP